LDRLSAGEPEMRRATPRMKSESWDQHSKEEIIERMGSLGLEGRRAKSEEPEGKKGRNITD